jgi:glutamate-ammonia-ligase adenylyltransferase
VDPREATRLARSLGYVREPRSSLREDYRRVTRRARRVVERVFYAD